MNQSGNNNNKMKKLHTLKLFMLIAGILSLFSLPTVNAQQILVQGKLDYMIKASPERIFEIAKTENKPVLIYVHSMKCFSSRKFDREVLNHTKVKSMMHKRFICMDADVDTKLGSAMARKHGILMMPALILYSPGKDIMFQCSMKCDTFEMMTQFRSFVSACSLLDQVSMQVTSGLVGEREALRLIGRSYADKDYGRDRDGSPKQRIFIRTLGIGYFKEFEEGYSEEWKAMVASQGKRKDFNVSKK